MLYSRRKKYPCDRQPLSYGNDLMAYFLFSAIEQAIKETKRKITTRNDDVLKYQEIAKSARQLLEKIKDSAIDHSPLHWFPIEAINTMLERDIKPEKEEGYFCLVQDESEYHRKGGIYKQVRAKDLNGNDVVEYWRFYENTKHFFNRRAITPQYPSLSTLLKNVATEADTAASREATKPRIVNRSSITKTTIFIRALYPFWFETFGGQLYRTFATLCRVILDDPNIDEDNIKEALRGYKYESDL